jgi:hypothetical protein
MKTTAILTFVSLALCPAFAQRPENKLPPPVPPVLVSYHYWPGLFVQWVGKELPYSMIQVYADRNAASPLYDVVLTERATGKRIHYANQQSLVDQANQAGDNAYLTAIGLKTLNETSSQGTYEFSFTEHDGTPVLWRFIQGSDVTDEGAGMTAIPGTPTLILMYREQGAVAAEGTALQVGNQVSEAELWKEISSPPYFLPYRGARTVGLDVATLIPGDFQWKVDSAPSTFAEGQGWTLSDTKGQHLHLVIEKITGDVYQIEEDGAPSAKTELTAKKTARGWLLETVRYEATQQGENHGITFTFQPPLSLQNPDAKMSKFDVQMGKNTRIGNGTVSTQSNGDGVQYVWQFKAPDWARSRTMTTTLLMSSDTVQVQATLK